MSRKVCVVTGSRADYGLLRWVMQGIKEHPSMDLSVLATGMHLSPEFGLTWKEIEKDGFVIDVRVEMLLSSDSPSGVAKSVGLGVMGFADALELVEPDLILVLGDRYEILAAVIAALMHRIPVAHLHGGEITRGAVDEQIRHAITKMSHLHFVATEEYRKRVIQLGEDPEKVFFVGGLGVDAIRNIALLERQELEDDLGIRFREKNLLVTFHPETLSDQDSEYQLNELLSALGKLENVFLIFTMPNADEKGRRLSKLIREFVSNNNNSVAITSMGQQRYLSCLKYVDGVIGNSSSGILEAPTMQVGTINIGNRQEGRARAESVIDCPAEEVMILKAIKHLFSEEFSECVRFAHNPYGEGGASKAIVDVISTIPLDGLVRKRFYDCFPISH